jgi:Transposase DDE domain
MTGDELKKHLQAVLPLEKFAELAKEYRFVQRARELDVVQFIIALVLSGGTHEAGRQFDVLRRYVESDAPRVARGAFYAWFTAPLERLLAHLLERAIAVGQAQPKLLPGILRGVLDWRIFDSTTIKLPNSPELQKEYPGTGDYAAIKIHKEFSVGTGNLVGYQFSPARDHDSPFLVVDETRRGTGLLIDLGYASLARLADCDTHDVRYVMRLKDNWKPKVDRLVRGAISDAVINGDDFDVLLEQDAVRLDGRTIDADVTLGRGALLVRSRLVGIHTPKGYCFFVTNLARGTHGPKQVGDLYRVRWEIEIDNKVDKSGARLDEIEARKGVTVRILLLASLLNTTIARTIVQSEKLAIRKGCAPAQAAKRPPLHTILLMRALASMNATVSRMVQSPGAPTTNWNWLMAALRHLSHDPNWRRSPSVLDTIQGLTAPPGRKRNQKANPQKDPAS